MVKTSMLEPFFSGIDIGESSRGFSEIMGKRELQPKLNEKILYTVHMQMNIYIHVYM